VGEGGMRNLLEKGGGSKYCGGGGGSDLRSRGGV